jgi:hypothetical protein
MMLLFCNCTPLGKRNQFAWWYVRTDGKQVLMALRSLRFHLIKLFEEDAYDIFFPFLYLPTQSIEIYVPSTETWRPIMVKTAACGDEYMDDME